MSCSEASLPFSSRVRTEELPPTTILVDTETRDSQGDGFQRLLCGCFEVWATNQWGIPCSTRHGRRPPLEVGSFTTEDEFYALLRRFTPCRVVAHNWQFDAGVVRLGSAKTMQKYGFSLDPSTGIYPIDRGGFSPFWMTLKWTDGGEVEFIDNTNFHKTSLANLAPSFGLEKLDMPDMTTADMDTILTYCARDVEILREAWFQVHQFSHKEAGITPGITVASMAQRMYAKRWFPLMPSDWKMRGNRNKPINDLEVEAYNGGRVDVFYRGVPKEFVNLNKFDANSMYPSCMLGCIPIEFLERCHPNEALGRIGADGMGDQAAVIHLVEATVEVPTDGMGWLGWEGVPCPGRGLIFPTGHIRGAFWQPAIWTALAAGWPVKIHNSFAYRAAPVFQGFVTDVFRLRAEAKAEGDAPRSLLFKILMNSLYGKFGQGNYGGWELVEGEEADWCRLRHQQDPVTRWTDFPLGIIEGAEACDYLAMGGRFWRWEEAEPGMGRRSICSIAGFITSRARAELLLAMRELHRSGAKIFMCDTDSIVTTGTLPDRLTGDDLGQWKLEESCPGEDAEFTAPKHYAFGDHIKCKGIRKPARGVYAYKQAQFSKFTTDLLSRRQERRDRLDRGVLVADLDKEVSGHNRKRSDVANGFNEPLHWDDLV